MFKPNDVPVPGYPLRRPLGRGQYGEVWEVEGPGGTRLALKFIPVHDAKGQVELRSIQAVKRIRHANLIPIHAVWLLDVDGNILDSDSLERAAAHSRQQKVEGTLVAGMEEGVPAEGDRIAWLAICMAMADGNLQDRLVEAVAGGEPGIPRDELLDYIQQAAAGLDFLNAPRHDVDGKTVGIQHRDIKPANLLLMGDTVVVGDFGVATTLKGFEATATTALGSLAFMSPESLSKKPSQASDQYSLAVSWYQLRTNSLPYEADVSLSELITIHREGLLSFPDVEPAERAILKKATSSDSRDRYGSCREFAAALRNCHEPSSASGRFRWAVPVVGALTGLLLLVGVLAIDPFGWFRIPPTPDANPAPAPLGETIVRKSWVLTLAPSEVTGEIRIQRGDAGDAEETIRLSGSTNLDLAGDERLQVRAVPENPFYAAMEKSFTFDELNDLEWKIVLPVLPREQLLESVDAMIASQQFDEAEALYLSAARFDASLRELPEPRIAEIESQITKLSLARDAAAFVVATRSAAGDRETFYPIGDGEIVPRNAPPGPNSSLIEALILSDDAKDLFVVRQETIEFRDTGGGDEAAEIGSGEDRAESGRFILARVSPDGHWLAAADNRGNVRLTDVSSKMNMSRTMNTVVDSPVVELLFDKSSSELLIVAEESPLLRLGLPESPEPDLAVEKLDLPSQWNGELITHAARVGDESLAIALESGEILKRRLGPGTDDFAVIYQTGDAAVSLLKGSREGDWLLVGTDGDLSAVIVNLQQEQPALIVGSHQMVSIRDASFSSDSQWAVVAAHDGNLAIVDLRTSEPRLVPLRKFDEGYVQFAGFTGNDRYLVAVLASSNPSSARVLVWDMARCRLAMKAAGVAAR